MRKFGPSIFWLSAGTAAAGCALLAASGVLKFGPAPAHSETPGKAIALEPQWAAAAPGRIEPKGRLLRIGAVAPGQIQDVLVALNERVLAGDLLVRLDDADLKERLNAARAAAAVRMTERDDVDARAGALERRKAEDAVYGAETAAFDARMDLDAALTQLKAGNGSAGEADRARTALAAAKDRAERERANLKRVLGEKLPAIKREEAALAAARADVASIQASIERTRVRAPRDATILELNAKIGEMAAAADSAPMIVLGDITRLQVRAEVEERDVPKIYPGQGAIVRCAAFPGRSFDARIAVVGRSLGAPQLTARGQRKQTDVDVLEAVLDLDDGVPLLPGMRVDVFFKETEAMHKSSDAKAKAQ